MSRCGWACFSAADTVFHLAALTIVISILAHSSTDILVARLFDQQRKAPAWHGVVDRGGRP